MPKARDADNEDVLAPLKRFPVPEVVFFLGKVWIHIPEILKKLTFYTNF